MIPLCANSTLEQEAALLATLRHPAIPQVYDFLVEQSGCCLEREFAPREDLERYLARTGQPVIESLLIHWAVQLLDVLSSLQTQQSQPIMFRDLKPSNIMLRPDETLCLIDVGIGRLFQPLCRDTVVSTVGYAPPERYRGIIDPRGDLSAPGATLYHFATSVDRRDQPPFSLSQTPSRRFDPKLITTVQNIVLQALAYDPRQRFSDAGVMAAARRALRDTPPSRPSATSSRQTDLVTRLLPQEGSDSRVLSHR